jgi:hypothetical protein
MGKTPVVDLRIWRRSLAALGVVAVLAVAGCGSDSSGETSNTTPTAAALPTVTSPLGTVSTQATSTTGGKNKAQGTATAPGTGSAPAACAVPDAYQDFKYAGLDCSSALAVATAWDGDAKDCNTVDNPDVPEGYNRTCSVEGFTCTAKRDVKSDNRFVSCTQGGKSVRFTWLPA